jgi:hypothetical protein
MPGLTLILAASLSAASLLAGAQAERFPTIDVPNDPAARYDVLMLVAERGGTLEIVTRRVGGSEATFVQREIDCRAGTMRYLGQGHSVEEMNADHRPYVLDSIDPQSISGHIADYACTHVEPLD